MYVGHTRTTTLSRPKRTPPPSQMSWEALAGKMQKLMALETVASLVGFFVEAVYLTEALYRRLYVKTPPDSGFDVRFDMPKRTC